ncbi:hypothetical protein GCM10010236_73970 [Streptomyces eurythermus]|nr:hypothetical protein GCM10010236_73970 [Streptomyces eurythermus]
MPRPPRIPGSGGGRRGIGGGPYKWRNAAFDDPRSFGGTVYKPGDRFGSDPIRLVDKDGIPVYKPSSGGRPRGPQRFPARPPDPEAARNRVVDKIVKKAQQQVKDDDERYWIGAEEWDIRRADEGALKAAREAAYKTYVDADHYPAGMQASQEAQDRDRRIYGKARRAAVEAYDRFFNQQKAFYEDCYNADVEEYKYLHSEDFGYEEGKDKCWCESGFIAEDMGMTMEQLRQTCNEHRR